MMWFKREPKPVVEKPLENGTSKLRKKKPGLLQPTRESSERETSIESEKYNRRYSDILDVTVSQERRTESDESLYESADGHSDAVSASDDAIPRLKTPAISKESLKLAITDEEVEIRKKGHRKTMSLSNPLEIVKNLGDELLRDFDKNNDKKKSRESLWSEEDRDSIHGSTIKLDQSRKDSKKDRKISTTDPPKSRKSSKGSSVSALNFLRRKKTPTSIKPIESVAEDGVKVLTIEEILNYTKLFLECEIRHSSTCLYRPPVETDSEDEGPTPKQKAEHRRRLSRQTSRSKSKVRGKSQSLKVNTLRKSHSGTLKKSKKQKSAKTPMSRSRQSSVVEHNMPVVKKKSSESMRHSSWLFSGYRDSRREGSTDEPTAPDTDLDVNDFNSKDPDKETNSHRTAPPVGRGVNRAESCRERDAPRRGKHRNASDPNRLTAHNNHDLEPGAPTAPSGSSSSSSLSSRSNESNTVVAEQQGTQSELSEEDEPLASAWASSVPASVLDALSARLRKRQEVIHELILSEGSHVRWLKVLGGVFLRGLESQPGLLPPDELKALFPNLPAVKERHQRLYAALKALRAAPAQPVVTIRSLADAILDTLGDPGYAPCLSRFCSGQRLALDVLRERRRKHKELHQFLCSKEQLPLCGRLQLKDLLACVWQRLTKYMLLLENILKTVDESDNESDEDVSRLRRALDVAKDVLHGVDSAIRNTENEHRLRSIQQKLEVRVPHGADWDEVRRLDLTHRALRLEGDLMLRGDAAKKIHVTALMFEDSLVLLQREGDKYILKPIPSNTSQQQPLSPLVKWDKVLFRPNAAVRNTFFLMSINRIQMHELSANTAQEYATWVKHIEEAPLAKLTELKSSLTHQTPCKPVDETVTNVSRNPSDASEKGSTTLASEEPELERDRASVERSSVESERDDNSSVKTDDRPSVDKEELSDREEKNIPRRPTVGCITTHVAPPPAPLQPPPEVNDPPHPLHTATTVCSPAEYLRRLDSQIRRLMSLRRDAVADMLCVPRRDYAQVAELCVADTLGNVDITTELRASGDRLSHSHSVEQDGDTEPDMNQLLLATFAQADEILSCVRRAMHVNEHDMMRARTRPHKSPEACGAEVTSRHVSDDVRRRVELCGACSDACDVGMQLPDDGDESSDCIETPISSAELACRLSSAALGLQDTTRRLLLASTAPPAPPALRAHLAALSETNHRLAHRATRAQPPSDIISDTEATPDTTIQEQPSNGG